MDKALRAKEGREASMKKILAMALALLLAFGAFALAEGDDLLARIQARGKIVIATEGDWAPWTYRDDSGEWMGLEIEMGRLIAEGLGVEAEFMMTPWDSILAGVDSGRFDIACNGVGVTEERAQKYSFTEPYVYTEVVLVVRADNEEIQSVDDLAGRSTANTASSTYAAIAEAKGATVTPVDNLVETIMLVEQGRVDATINAKATIEEYLAERPDANIKIVQVLDEGEPVAYPLRKGPETETLLAAVNAILEDARADGTLGAISEKYLGADLTRAE